MIKFNCQWNQKVLLPFQIFIYKFRMFWKSFHPLEYKFELNWFQTGKQTEFILVELDRSLTFPSVEYIRYVITKSSKAWGQNSIPMVVDCHHIQFADFTAAQGLQGVVQAFTKRGQMIILWKVKPSLIRLLEGLRGEFTFCHTEDELEQRLGMCLYARMLREC
jgi:anti-anti-sigma regulatory factor